MYINEESNARISFSTFNDNRAIESGGALCVRDRSVVTINESVFGNSAAEVRGGALYLDEGSAIMQIMQLVLFILKTTHTSQSGRVYLFAILLTKMEGL